MIKTPIYIYGHLSSNIWLWFNVKCSEHHLLRKKRTSDTERTPSLTSAYRFKYTEWKHLWAPYVSHRPNNVIYKSRYILNMNTFQFWTIHPANVFVNFYNDIQMCFSENGFLSQYKLNFKWCHFNKCACIIR